jgi:hypothetical protein
VNVFFYALPETSAEAASVRKPGFKKHGFSMSVITASIVPVLPQALLVRGNPLKPLTQRRIFVYAKKKYTLSVMAE